MSEPESNELSGGITVVYRGKLADSGTLLFDEYVASLEGWREAFRLASDLYLRSIPQFRKQPASELLRIEIAAERKGSYEVALEFVLLAIAGGVIGNRADAALVASFKGLIRWWRDLVTTHLTTKRQSTDIDALAAALEAMARSHEIDIEPTVLEEEQSTLLLPNSKEVTIADAPVNTIDDDEIEEFVTRVSRTRAITERLDESIEKATRPLEASCSLIVLLIGEDELLKLGGLEREVAKQPLTLPPPNGDWRKASVRFVRINKKTGRALFHFENEASEATGAHFSRISDPAVRLPGNAYTQAFSDDKPLAVWIRQRRAEKGKLNILWEITLRSPLQDTLFETAPEKL